MFGFLVCLDALTHVYALSMISLGHPGFSGDAIVINWVGCIVQLVATASLSVQNQFNGSFTCMAFFASLINVVLCTACFLKFKGKYEQRQYLSPPPWFCGWRVLVSACVVFLMVNLLINYFDETREFLAADYLLYSATLLEVVSFIPQVHLVMKQYRRKEYYAATNYVTWRVISGVFLEVVLNTPSGGGRYATMDFKQHAFTALAIGFFATFVTHGYWWSDSEEEREAFCFAV